MRSSLEHHRLQNETLLVVSTSPSKSFLDHRLLHNHFENRIKPTTSTLSGEDHRELRNRKDGSGYGGDWAFRVGVQSNKLNEEMPEAAHLFLYVADEGEYV
ncbi:hypothetical protein L2E82_18436 [Cichorium intybus]|uniref:Uncharacterized protein n=1 Tax=Cichorium intybus TaxID=13427 RepID=A0ACB9FAK4_CICIN|nr:hypothetical protein L2E82_18436 [Cichorium intybus]